MLRIFENRREAGRLLAEKLLTYAGRDDVVVLGLPRGGVPVAFEVAQRLRVPLDVFVVRKLGVPGQEELAFGAIASGGGRVLNSDLVRALRLPDSLIQRVASSESIELKRRDHIYRGDRPFPNVSDTTVIIVDDGLATGASMRAAVEALRKLGPKEIVVAVPVGSYDTCESFNELADVVCVCGATPEPFYGVGMWYEDFSQTSDAEVHDLLELSRVAAPRRNHG
jgi:predicted phosphoribosyltransferase